ncbi:MAG: 4-carboxymuconolactone decarboxylase [Myxococcales bacterium]|nr:4-carboxymuconolactone decarboxylase [Myxococcales bacterium]|tara:strand:+ start:1401 stop:1733 length:333 start_codon:yes stop_codon:yes gene_type:complete
MSDYYKAEHLDRFGSIAEGSPELGEKFFSWYAACFQDGALTAREKALIALAVSHTVQCAYCIDAYSKECLEKGSDLEEMTEAIHVASAIRGGAALVHGMQMLDHVKKVSM